MQGGQDRTTEHLTGNGINDGLEKDAKMHGSVNLPAQLTTFYPTRTLRSS